MPPPATHSTPVVRSSAHFPPFSGEQSEDGEDYYQFKRHIEDQLAINDISYVATDETLFASGRMPKPDEQPPQEVPPTAIPDGAKDVIKLETERFNFQKRDTYIRELKEFNARSTLALSDIGKALAIYSQNLEYNSDAMTRFEEAKRYYYQSRSSTSCPV